MMKIATHNGAFHADEVFAVAILKNIYSNSKIIRTRDKKLLEKADIRIDVGMKYDPETRDFDHHQQEFNRERKNGVPYASAGLVWEEYGLKICDNDEVFKKIDENLFEYIDADDNGMGAKYDGIAPYTLKEVISIFNPVWPNKTSKQQDEQFDKAVEIAKTILEKEIERIKRDIESRKVMLQKIKETDKEYIVLEEDMPWKETIIKNSDIKLVVFPSFPEEIWFVFAVPISEKVFETRMLLPKSWEGLHGEDFARVTKVKDAVFCHKKRFAAGAKSKEGAIKLAELALRN